MLDDIIKIFLEVFLAAAAVSFLFYAISLKNRRMIGYAILSIFVIFFADVTSAYFTRSNEKKAEQERQSQIPAYEGTLAPGDDAGTKSNPSSPADYAVPSGMAEVVFGSNVVLTKNLDAVVLKAGCQPIISMSFDGTQLFVSADVEDSSGKYIAKIIDNRFKSSEERAFSSLQTTPHSLRVRDMTGAVVLDVDYVNASKMIVNGRFYVNGSSPIIATDTSTRIGSNEISDSVGEGLGTFLGVGECQRDEPVIPR